LDIDITIKSESIHTNINDKRDDFDFGIVNYPLLDKNVPHATSSGFYISQLIRFAKACSNVKDFNERNISITGKLFKQGYRYHKIRK
jgi:hypothetical protein